MIAPIGPGDYVECVDDRRHVVTGECGLVRGSVYCVREVVSVNDKQGFRLTTIVMSRIPSGEERAWNVKRFRPIYRRSDKFKKACLEPVPAKKRKREIA